MKKGFTLVELVIVIVIVGILSIVAVPIYSGYIEKARNTEGKSLLAAIRTAQDVYYAEHGDYYNTGYVFNSNNDVLGINAKGNKHYTQFATGPQTGGTSNTAAIYANVFDPKEGIHIGLVWLRAGQTYSAAYSNGAFKAPYFYYDKNGVVTGSYS